MNDFVFPEGVDGWLSRGEGATLADAARGKIVLEIGSYCGLSTICMAQTAAKVISVDTHDGRGTPDQRNTLLEFMGNLKKHSVSNNVEVFVGTSTEFAKKEVGIGQKYEFIFIDGSHDPESVREDIRVALALLKDGGLIAFHDYKDNVDSDYGVAQEVNKLLDAGAVMVSRSGCLAFVNPNQRKNEKEKVVAIAMPIRDTLSNQAAMAAYLFPTRDRSIQLIHFPFSTSIIPFNCNTILKDALNARDVHGITHFAMIHSDVGACQNWLDILLATMEAEQAGIVSTVIALKDGRGLTSTALEDQNDEWNPRRLTMAELFQLPETFGIEQANAVLNTNSPMLLVNSGCMLIDFQQDFIDGIWFEQKDRIVKVNGKRVAETSSEDWNFCRKATERGAKVLATRAVQVEHERPEWHNKSIWGAWKTDKSFFAKNQVKA